MHKIYEDEGRDYLIYRLPRILYSTIISILFNYLIKYLSLSQKNLLQLKNEENVENLNTKIDILCEEIMDCFQNKESVNGNKTDDDENDDDVEIIRKLHSENIINNKNMIYIFIIVFISILL